MKFIKKYSPAIVFLIIVFTLTVSFFVIPKKEISVNEKRPLAELPQADGESFLDGSLMTDFETYLSDHFPARDMFVGVNSYYNLLIGKGAAESVYYGKDGYLIGAQEDYSSEDIIKNLNNYSVFSDTLGLDSTVMIVPSTGYVMDDKLPLIHKNFGDDEYYEAIAQNLGTLEFIDLREDFKTLAESKQLYYKTDHHLTASGSYELYKAYCESKAIPVTPESDYSVETYNGFYGTMYMNGCYWMSKPDDIELWYNDKLDVAVEISNGKDEPTVYDSLFFKDHIDELDKYPVYLNGNNGLVKITNKNSNGKKLLIVKDSFAHCAVTMLAEHYSEIYMVDLRYFSDSATEKVSDIVKNNQITEALFLFGLESLATDSTASFRLYYGIENEVFS